MTEDAPAVRPSEIASWLERYEEVRPLYETLAARLATLLADLLAEALIDYAQIEYRAKSVASFADKLKRKDSKYRDPLQEVTDLCGLRIITYTLRDAVRASELVHREFTINRAHSVEKPQRPDPDRFGYVSTHFVVTLQKPRIDLAEWAPFDNRSIELQVRTVLQHAWAAIDHKLNYKSATELPRDVQRQLFRVSALLEVADEQFDDVQHKSDLIASEYGQQVKRGNLERLDLDITSLEAYLNSALPKKWRRRLTLYGCRLITDEPIVERDRRDLLTILKRVDIETLHELDAVLQDAERWGKPLVVDIDRMWREEEEGEAVDFSVPELLTLFVLYGALATRDIVDLVGWPDHLADRIEALIDAARRPGRRRAGEIPRPRHERAH